MAHIGNGSYGSSGGRGSARGSVFNNTISRINSSDTKHSESDITKRNDDDMKKFLQALKIIQNYKLDQLEQLLPERNTAKPTIGLDGQERDVKLPGTINWQEKYKQLEKHCEDLQQKFDMIDSDMENKNQIMKKEVQSYQEQLQEKDRQLDDQRKLMMKVCKEKEDALSRLSRQMGQQILEGNPNITDLSDPNRPNKLGERYAELYDNEWTNAFEELTINYSVTEEYAIDVLRNILWESYNSAFAISRRQMEDLEDKLSGLPIPVCQECKRMLKEARKRIDIKQVDGFIKDAQERPIMKSIEKEFPNAIRVHEFAKECFHLCWLMSIQDPPVILAKEPTQGSKFDTSIYKHYLNSGDIVKYVVWPALLLYEEGPVLSKGIAQPFTRQRPNSAFALGENKKPNYGKSDKFSQSLRIGKEQENHSTSLHVGKVQKKTSPTDRGNPGQNGCAAQLDSSCRNKLDNDLTGSRTTQGGMEPAKRYVASPTQFSINKLLVDDHDRKRFNNFCNWYPKYPESDVRKVFGSTFDRYYELYLDKIYGDHSST